MTRPVASPPDDNPQRGDRGGRRDQKRPTAVVETASNAANGRQADRGAGGEERLTAAAVFASAGPLIGNGRRINGALRGTLAARGKPTLQQHPEQDAKGANTNPDNNEIHARHSPSNGSAS